MEYPLGLLVVFLILFAPLGLALHWLALGASARLQALPLTLTTGLAVFVVLLAAARKAGIDAASVGLSGGLLMISVLVALAVWRKKATWRSRELLGAFVLCSFMLMLLAMPLVEKPGGGNLPGSGGAVASLLGPVGYGTRHEPVEQVATAEAATGDPARGRADVSVLRRADATTDDRFTGFEQLLGFVVGSGSRSDASGPWSAYSLYTPLMVLVAGLLTLPVFVLARSRGLRTLALLGVVLLGVTSPILMAAAGMAQAPGILASLFAVCALTALLLARRDRGWYAIGAVYGAAAFVVAGPLALLPVATVGAAWILLRGNTREHLANTDVPTSAERPIAAGVLAVMFALFGTASAITAGSWGSWEAMNSSVLRALTSWPLTWIGPQLRLTGPTEPWEVAVALAGPALLIIAIAYGISRKELRELAVILGSLVAVAIGLAITFADREAGIAIIEYSLLTVTPLLAIVCVRIVVLAREARDSKLAGKHTRYAGIGPLAFLLVLLTLSISATGSTGARIVHAPELEQLSLGKPGGAKILLAAGDPWLAYVVGGDRASGGDSVDADALARPRGSLESTLTGGYDRLVLSTNPLGSDPPTRYVESPALDGYGARLFEDTVGVVKGEAPSTTGSGAPTLSPSNNSVPDRHHPAEGDDAEPDRLLGGLLVPPEAPKGCSPEDRPIQCDPKSPAVSRSCRPGDIDLARSQLDRDSPRFKEQEALTESDSNESVSVLAATGGAVGETLRRREAEERERATAGDGDGASGTGDRLATTVSDAAPERPLLGVTCWEVEISNNTRSVKVHVRDVGYILTPGDTRSSEDVELKVGARAKGIYGGDWVKTSGEPVDVHYGGRTQFVGNFDITMEGDFGSGAAIELPQGSAGTVSAVIQRTFDGFSPIIRERAINGQVSVAVPNGSAVQLGRMFVRPTDTLARSCDMSLSIPEGDSLEGEQGRTSERAFTVIDARDNAVREPSLVLHLADLRRPDSGNDRVKGNRVARLVMGSYMQHNQLPRFVMVDWTEEFIEAGLSPPPCAHARGEVDPAGAGGIDGEQAASDGDGAG